MPAASSWERRVEYRSANISSLGRGGTVLKIHYSCPHTADFDEVRHKKK